MTDATVKLAIIHFARLYHGAASASDEDIVQHGAPARAQARGMPISWLDNL